MLHLIPAPLHRLALRLAHAVRKLWWRIHRPQLSGCRVLVLDKAGRVLLVRHHYGSGNWMLPGGAMQRGEEPLSTAVRELAEEVGCRLDEAVLALVTSESLHGAINVVHLVAGTTTDTPVPDQREIAAVRWCDPADLPPNLSPAQREGLPHWLTAAAIARRA
jgi:8-oxo-dGTP pyrophosphatase MutT (NUDIX family)